MITEVGHGLLQYYRGQKVVVPGIRDNQISTNSSFLNYKLYSGSVNKLFRRTKVITSEIYLF